VLFIHVVVAPVVFSILQPGFLPELLEPIPDHAGREVEFTGKLMDGNKLH